MGQGISEVLPFAIGIAISPIPIIAIVLILFSNRATVNGLSYGIGNLEVVSLRELRERMASVSAGAARTSTVVGDVRALHRLPANRGALFQVASQFNLLEMANPTVTPEEGAVRRVSAELQRRRVRVGAAVAASC